MIDFDNVGSIVSSPTSGQSSAACAVPVEPRQERSLLSRIGSWVKGKGKRKVKEVEDPVKAALANARPILDARAESSSSLADMPIPFMLLSGRRSVSSLEVLDGGPRGEQCQRGAGATLDDPRKILGI